IVRKCRLQSAFSLLPERLLPKTIKLPLTATIAVLNMTVLGIPMPGSLRKRFSLWSKNKERRMDALYGNQKKGTTTPLGDLAAGPSVPLRRHGKDRTTSLGYSAPLALT